MGLNNITENITPDKKAIVTLESFIERQNEIQKQVEAGVIKGGQHMLFLEKLLDFQKALILFYGKSIDPIEYIHNLYFKEHQSFQSIAKTCQSIFEKTHITQSIFKTSSAIQKFAKDRLNWKLKNQHESKNTFQYKSKHHGEMIVLKNEFIKSENEIIFLNWYIKNSNFSQENISLLGSIENFKHQYEKCAYILKYILGISKEHLIEIKNDGVSSNSFTHCMQKIFRQENIPIELTIMSTRLIYKNIDNYDSI